MMYLDYDKSNYITIGYIPLPGCLKEQQDKDFEKTKEIVKKYCFCYFSVNLQYGVYERYDRGFYINIENNHKYYVYDYQDKKLGQEEITEIKKMLLELVDTGLMVSIKSGRMTRYKSRKETLSDIRKAVKAMRQEVKSTPTWRQVSRHTA